MPAKKAGATETEVESVTAAAVGGGMRCGTEVAKASSESESDTRTMCIVVSCAGLRSQRRRFFVGGGRLSAKAVSAGEG